VYLASSKFRHDMNHVKRQEPTKISDLPD